MTHPDPQNYAMVQFYNYLRLAQWANGYFFHDWRKVRREALANAIGFASIR